MGQASDSDGIKEILQNTKDYFAGIVAEHGGVATDLKVDLIAQWEFTVNLGLSYSLEVEVSSFGGNYQVQGKLDEWKKKENILQLELNEALSNNDPQYSSGEILFKELDSLSVSETCSRCSGTGRENCPSCNGTGKSNCTICYGTGYRNESVSGYDSTGNTVYSQVQRNCSTCYGTGQTNCSRCSTGTILCSMCSGTGHITKNYSIQSVMRPSNNIFIEDDSSIASEVVAFFRTTGVKNMRSIVAMARLGDVPYPKLDKNDNPFTYYSGKLNALLIRVHYLELTFEALTVNTFPDIRKFPLAEHILQGIYNAVQDCAHNINRKSVAQINTELESLSHNPLIKSAITNYKDVRVKQHGSKEKASDALKMGLYKVLDVNTTKEFSKVLSNNLIAIIEGSTLKQGLMKGIMSSISKDNPKRTRNIILWLMVVVAIILMV
jgi:hypothetical protein